MTILLIGFRKFNIIIEIKTRMVFVNFEWAMVMAMRGKGGARLCRAGAGLAYEACKGFP